jgi:serine/threonine protein kinase
MMFSYIFSGILYTSSFPDTYLLSGGISRLGDIWSFGCVVYELVLWLLYGLEAVYQFHLMARDDDQPIRYWNQTSFPRGASIIRYFQVWTQRIWENDPECTAKSSSAIRSLIELVRDKCLVVHLPEDSNTAGVDGRANASHLCDRFTEIINQAQRGTSYCFTGATRDSIRKPFGVLDFDGFVRSPKHQPRYPQASLLESRPRVQPNVTTAYIEYTNASYSDWSLMEDVIFARKIVQLSEIEKWNLFALPKSSMLCKHAIYWT